jgi:hypothetical protein
MSCEEIPTAIMEEETEEEALASVVVSPLQRTRISRQHQVSVGPRAKHVWTTTGPSRRIMSANPLFHGGS